MAPFAELAPQIAVALVMLAAVAWFTERQRRWLSLNGHCSAQDLNKVRELVEDLSKRVERLQGAVEALSRRAT